MLLKYGVKPFCHFPVIISHQQPEKRKTSYVKAEKPVF